ncbi:unnamed protein product [Callosobruchus maculatus]|uniref:Uncharacterized protein n=1 Tax=Callosobruchus maculatus TaxID=64391 RepID=A0A653C9Q7_CALMS|nr:unnamed protein product [Callosobruchus maculatus]
MFSNCARRLELLYRRQVSRKCGLHGRPNFTKNNYKVTRGHFGYLEEGHILYFQKLLGDARVLTDLSDLENYNVDRYTQRYVHKAEIPTLLELLCQSSMKLSCYSMSSRLRVRKYR